jgi:excisionase family DNA binding protein
MTTIEDPPILTLLTEKQVAKAFSVAPRTIRRLSAAGKLPVIRVGDRLARYRPEDVRAFLESSVHTGRPVPSSN